MARKRNNPTTKKLPAKSGVGLQTPPKSATYKPGMSVNAAVSTVSQRIRESGLLNLASVAVKQEMEKPNTFRKSRIGSMTDMSISPSVSGRTVESAVKSLETIRSRALRESALYQTLKPPEDRQTCKARPEKTSGNGGSRPFVPWCDRKS